MGAFSSGRSAYRSALDTTGSVALAILGAILVFAFVVAIVFGVWAVLALLFQWAWGLVVVPVFKLTALTFWQSFGIIVILAIVRNMLASPSSKSQK